MKLLWLRDVNSAKVAALYKISFEI